MGEEVMNRLAQDVLELEDRIEERDRAAEQMTTDEFIDQMKNKNTTNPRALTNTVFLNNSMFFGMRSRLEHQNLRLGDITLKTTSAGEKYLEFTERATKTRSGATSDARAFSPKMFENKGKRPEKMKADDSKFYVGINNKGYGDEWFINQPMEKNTLFNIIKSRTDEAGIQGRKVNHSARKTGITTLIHAGVQNTLVQQHSGHKSLSSINNYSSASFQQQKDMSKVLCKFTSNQDSTTYINQNTIQPGDSTANLNNVDTIPDDDDDMVLVRASQEMIENTLLDIENFENYEVLDIHNDIHVDNCKKSSNLVQNNTDMSVRMFENYSVPSILQGATVKGNVIINYGNPIEEKENYQRQTQKKRIWVIYDSSDSD
ncbi:unnamed protein product [Mytilus coruscus]|uniref:Tyr recombinase domain-containing protein n=1 Tax=Mytilus coruscus TaxID=42192 RepID=A0A6J8B1T6_MYTCO|nr:unnamed protein product [Mytilus coruscus]